MPAERKPTKPVSLKVKADLLSPERGKGPVEAAAYAFSGGGRLLAQAALDSGGAATLSFPSTEERQAVRVVVGPVVKDAEVRLADLMRRGAEERHVRIDPDDFTPQVIIPVIPDKWLCWFLSRCFVRGTLLKRIVSGGIPIDLPVCHATVEVYEVDPIPVIVARLPDLEIERIRDIIVNPPLPPPPPPIDDLFPPRPGPRPPVPPGPGPEFRSARAIQGAAPPSAPTELQYLARHTDTDQFRRVLVDHAVLVRPLFCLLFPPVTTQLVATATTDDCGHFQTFFFRGCHNPDTPDLYFKAKQKIIAFLPPITIYAPAPIVCHTHWNYQCGTHVTLRTTNALAITCRRCEPVIAPPDWVLVMAIGNRPLSLIRGASVPLQSSTTTTNVGLTLTKAQAEASTPGDGAPFGGLLRPRIEFDNSLRAELGVKYYRVSYRKGASGAFVPLTGTINRHYTLEVGGDLVLKVYNLGPQVVGTTANLFEIPPDLPPVGQWTIPDAVEDTTSAKFPTLALAPGFDPTDAVNRGVAWPERGTYQLKIDLFDAGGNLVDIDNVAPGRTIKYRVPAVTDLSGDIDTDDAATLSLVTDDDGDSKKSFIMTLHVDNSSCKAEIDAPMLDGTPASPNCGVLEYDPAAPGSVTMPHMPRYPSGTGTEGFATFQFRVKRGVTDLALAGLGVVTPTPLPPVALTNTQTVNDLLGGCTTAGFAEILNVWAEATDGWQRLQQYDSHEVRAFVLAPEPGS